MLPMLPIQMTGESPEPLQAATTPYHLNSVNLYAQFETSFDTDTHTHTQKEMKKLKEHTTHIKWRS